MLLFDRNGWLTIMKQMDKIKKIIFLVVIFVLGIFIMYASYTANKFENIYSIVEPAINDKNYEEVIKTFGGIFDTKPIVKSDNEKVDIRVYNGTSTLDLTYGEKRSMTYEQTYYIYMFDINFDHENFEGTSNETALIFNWKKIEF